MAFTLQYYTIYDIKFFPELNLASQLETLNFLFSLETSHLTQGHDAYRFLRENETNFIIISAITSTFLNSFLSFSNSTFIK